MLKNVISVIDGMAGSCGKGKVIGEIVTDPSIKVGAAVTNCMPNAGHTFEDECGHKVVFQNIPVSAVNPNVDLFIGSGSAIDMDNFVLEYKRIEKYLGDRKIYVDATVPLIEERHKIEEKRRIQSGSTFEGCGPVSAEKLMRDPSLQYFKTYKNAIACSSTEWLDRLYSHLDKDNEYTILEGAQGCDLSLNHSDNNPYTTSRNVSTTKLLEDSGIPETRSLGTIMVIRPFPIRINNITKDGKYIYTGRMGNGEELYWTQLNISSQEHALPFKNDIESGYYDFQYDLEKSINYVKYLYSYLPDYFQKQLFKDYYQHPDWKNIKIIIALEIERLYFKTMRKNPYFSNILKDGNNAYSIFDLSEQTTVTKMERRLFWLDIEKLKNNIRINDPYGLYLNFFQHVDQEYLGMKCNYSNMPLDPMTTERYIDWLEESTNKEILAFGTGSKNGERILKRKLIPDIQKNNAIKQSDII